VPNVVGLGQTV